MASLFVELFTQSALDGGPISWAVLFEARRRGFGCRRRGGSRGRCCWLLGREREKVALLWLLGMIELRRNSQLHPVAPHGEEKVVKTLIQ